MKKANCTDKSFTIGDRVIGRDSLPFVIAELSANHNGSLERALAIIDAVAETGVDAVKLQTYTPDTITLDVDNPDFHLTEGPWAGRSLYELYEWAHTPWEWHGALFQRAREKGLLIFSSPFDSTAVDFLEQFDPPAYKIASFELIDTPLIEYVARTGQPMIMSTGMASEIEIMDAVLTARRAGCGEICLLHCTSGYPTPPDECELGMIPQLADRYDIVPGLSDHTLEPVVPITAVSLGAAVIEKHVTLSRKEGGPDAAFSLEPVELEKLVRDVRTAWAARGQGSCGIRSSEVTQHPLRRSLYVAEDMKAGQRFTKANLRVIRPGYGLSPRHFDYALGHRVTCNVTKGTALRWDLIKDE